MAHVGERNSELLLQCHHVFQGYRLPTTDCHKHMHTSSFDACEKENAFV